MSEAAATTLGGAGDAGTAATGGSGAGNSGSGNGAGASGAGAQASGGESKSWRDSLPEDIRTNAAISSFQDVGSLAKSFIHAQSIVGKKGVVVPAWDKATPEEQASFFQQIGVPAADKYEIAAPKDYKMQDAVLGQFKEQAVKNGLLPKQANAILDWYAKFEKDSVAGAQAAQKAQQTAALEGLKKEWGEGYDKEVSAARFAVKEIGGDDLIKHLNQTGIGNDPVVIKAFAKAAKWMGEDKLREGGVSNDGMTPGEVQSALNELRANGDQNGLYDKNHPAHATTLSKMESLAKKLTQGR